LRVNAYQIRKARLTQLVEQGLSRAAELNDVEVNLALAEAEREAARAALRVAFVSESQATKLLSDRGTLVLRAPSAAMVVRVTTRPGEVREPGGGALLELVGQGNVQIEARFAYAPPPDARFVWLAGDASLALVYDATSPLAAPEDGSRLVWLHPADPAHAPVPGSLGRVRLQAAADWWVLPITALRMRGAESSVLLRTEQGEHEQAVTVVLRSSSEVIVRGLSSNDELAVEGHARAEQRELDAGTRSGPP
jgi:multidrug efflux pump subunit AcrA (membrane-fusion protein)